MNCCGNLACMHSSINLSAMDRFAVKDLFSVYHWALDTADVETLVDTFVEDAVVVLRSLRGNTRYVGRTGQMDLAESLWSWERFPGCQHFAGQIQMVGEGPQHCRVKSFHFVVESRGKSPHSVRFAGRSDDRLVRRANRWLFQERLISLWSGEAITPHWIQL